MFSTPYQHLPTASSSPNVSFTEFGIGGKLLTARMEISIQEKEKFSTDNHYREFIKAELATQLVKAMIENKLIEFIYRNDTLDYTTKISASCYVTKDDQVKILREYSVRN